MITFLPICAEQPKKSVVTMEPIGCCGPVTALAYASDGSVISAQCAYVNVYGCGGLRSSCYAGFTVYGVRCRQWKAVAWGGMRLSLFRLDTLEITLTTTVCDWLRDVSLLADILIAVSAHGAISVLSSSDFSVLATSPGPAIGLLYSAEIFGTDLNSLRLACGTAEKTVLLWSREESVSLQGHRGAVYKVRFSDSGTHVLSVSDDRTARLWDTEKRCCELTLRGHSARVWDACYLQGVELFATAGEDCTVRIWRRDICVKSLTFHSGRSVWSLAVNGDCSLLASGGQDGQIVQVSVCEAINQSVPLRSFVETAKITVEAPNKEEIATVVLCEECVFMATVAGRVYRLQGEEWLLYAECAVAVTALCCSQSTLALGDSHGRVSFRDIRTAHIATEAAVSSIRITDIFNTHDADYEWITGNPNGEIVLWMHLQPAERLCVFHRIFAGVIIRRKVLFGDALGTLSIFSLSPSCLLQRFPSLHSHCRLTSISLLGESLFTTGRDGHINRFSLSETGFVLGGVRTVPSDSKAVERFSAEQSLALLFLKSEIALYDTKSDVILYRAPCLGPGLPYIWEAGKDRITLCYSLRNALVVTTGRVSSPQTTITPRSSALFLGTNGHGREILAIAGANLCDCDYVLTGGEGALLKVFRLSPQFPCLATVSGHPSSIRAIAVFPCTDKSRCIFVSAGGKMAVFLWEISQCGEGIQVAKLSSMRLKGELEQRIMCIDTMQDWTVAGDSGGGLCTMRLQILLQGARLIPCVNFPESRSVVLCTKLFSLSGIEFVASGATSGCVRVHRLDGELAAEEKTHQLGVNSLALWVADCAYLVTGGDDQSIVLSGFSVQSGLSVLAILPLGHQSAIKGVAIRGNFLISVSWDARISLWTLPHLQLLTSHSHSVGDCAGLTLIRSTAILAGLGLESFCIEALTEG